MTELTRIVRNCIFFLAFVNRLINSVKCLLTVEIVSPYIILLFFSANFLHEHECCSCYSSKPFWEGLENSTQIPGLHEQTEFTAAKTAKSLFWLGVWYSCLQRIYITQEICYLHLQGSIALHWGKIQKREKKNESANDCNWNK